MVPIQVIVLLMLVTLPGEWAAGGGAPGGTATMAGGPVATWWNLGLPVGWLVAAHLALLALAAVRVRVGIRALHEPGAAGSAILNATDRMLGWSRWATLMVTAGPLYATGLPEVVYGWIGQTQVLKHVPMLAELLFAAPAVLTWLGLWTLGYTVESASRERALPYRLARGLPAHDMPTLGQYLSMQCRHNFYILLPVLVHGLISMTGGKLGKWVPHAEEVSGVVGVAVVLFMVPWLMVKVWWTVPLAGALREKLDAVAVRHRLRFRNILLWKTHHAVTNAAILGWNPFSRYFLMTDALLESLTDRQIEAVFAHEVGHGVHKHIWWYIASFIGAMLLAWGVSILWTLWMPGRVALFAGSVDATMSLVTLLMIGTFLMWGFPWISRRFEHQADWFACRHMAESLAKEPVKVDGDLPPELREVLSTVPTAAETLTLEQYIAGAVPGGGSLVVMPSGEPVPALKEVGPGEAGAEVFISALDSITDAAHKSRNKKGWMHPSIHGRIDLLRALASEEGKAAWFGRRMVWTRVVVAGFILMGAAVAWGAYVTYERQAGAATQGADTQGAETRAATLPGK